MAILGLGVNFRTARIIPLLYTLAQYLILSAK